MPEFVRVAAVSEIPAGTIREVDAGGHTIALANVDGEYFALSNVCVHAGGPLGQGLLECSTVECPWHGWQYDVKTGICGANPRARIPTFPVKVEGGDVFVAL